MNNTTNSRAEDVCAICVAALTAFAMAILSGFIVAILFFNGGLPDTISWKAASKIMPAVISAAAALQIRRKCRDRLLLCSVSASMMAFVVLAATSFILAEEVNIMGVSISLAAMLPGFLICGMKRSKKGKMHKKRR